MSFNNLFNFSEQEEQMVKNDFTGSGFQRLKIQPPSDSFLFPAAGDGDSQAIDEDCTVADDL